MATELVIYGARQFGIKEYPSRAISMVLREYRMGDCHEDEAYTDRCSFLCFSGQRGNIALYLLRLCMYGEHLCVVALTSIE